MDEFRDNSLSRKLDWPDGYVDTLPIWSEYEGFAEQLLVGVSDPKHSANLAVPGPSGLQRITHEGDDQIAKLDLGAVQTVHWTSKEGIALEGIVTFSAGIYKGTKYRFLVLPHGGPEASDLLGLDAFGRLSPGWVMWCCNLNIAAQPEPALSFRRYLSTLRRWRLPGCGQRDRLRDRGRMGGSKAAGDLRLERREGL